MISIEVGSSTYQRIKRIWMYDERCDWFEWHYRAFHELVRDAGGRIDTSNRILDVDYGVDFLGLVPFIDQLVFDNDRDATLFILRWS